MNILAVSSEVYPLAKTGGLGDAVSGLAAALSSGAARVTVLLPAYQGVSSHVDRMRRVATLTDLPGGDAELWAAHCPELDLPVLLLKNDALYARSGLYLKPDGTEYEDNAVRFAALSQAAARICQGILGLQRPHVVHAHDWHAALVPIYLRQRRVEDVKSVLTLHNIAFQGVFPMSLAPRLGIEEAYCTSDGLEHWGQMNFLKGGIRYADLITVVSGNYAREILTPRFGCGLEHMLTQRRADLISIPNGIDTVLWNPRADQFLDGEGFDAECLENKQRYKKALQEFFGLAPVAGTTLMAMGSRLTTQKMADVAMAAIPRALDAHPDLQVCVMGQGEKGLEQGLLQVAERYPGRCGVHVGFDEPQAHLLHAGADVLLHGSRFEPFGLTPLYAMRYGSVPIGSRVGGMADTIVDPGGGVSTAAMRAANGILFDGEQPDDMLGAIHRAMALRRTPDVWRAIQVNGMKTDYSWEKSAPAYLSAYQALRPDVMLGRIPERRSAVVGARGWKPVLPAALRNAPVSGPSTGVAMGRSALKGLEVGGAISAREPSAA
nr:glycogen synthase GlgA [Parapusillimonas granuli]